MKHGLLLAAALLCLCAPSALAQQAVTLYVAPGGSDRAQGTRGAPFATVARAQQAVRALKQKEGGALPRPVTVYLRGGTYFLAQPLTFTPDDSGTAAAPITYAAYPGETPVISGGKRITGWRRVSGSLWRAPVTGPASFRSLRVGEADAIRARTPNFDPQHPHTGGWWFTQWSGPPWERGAFGQAVGNLQGAGTKLGWDFISPAAGAYTVWLRYAHAMKTPMDGNTSLRLGDTAPEPLNDLPDTGDWSKFRWAKVTVLSLGAGSQKMTWENVKGGGINLDALVLTDDPNWDPANAQVQDALPPVAGGKHRILIEAEAADTVVGDAAVPKDFEGGPSDRISVTPAQMAAIHDWAGAEVNIFPAWGWVNARLPVLGVDAARHTLRVNAQEQIWMNNRFYVENVREALDSPGEWFLDGKAHQLLYQARPGETPKAATVPAMDRLMTLAGDGKTGRYVEDVHFKGLTFSDTDYTLGGYYQQADAALWLSMARRCVFDRCHFAHLGGYAARLEQKSSANAIVRCTMASLGGGGVILLGDTATQPTNNIIAANDIHDCGRVYAHVAGVYVTTGSGNRILNNRIARMPRYGVSLKSYDGTNYSHDNAVEYNDIEDTNLETNDTGAIETLGRDKADSGNKIRFNLIRNVVGLKVTTDGVLHTPYFTWGIYLDDFSSGTTIEGNVVDGTVVGAVCIHNGRNNLVQNNVFLNGSEMNIRLQPHGDDFMHGNVFRDNIIAYKDPKAILWFSYQGTWNRNILGEVDHNLYWNTGGLNLAATPQPITPEGPWAKWRAAGLDAHSRIADPKLADPAKGDYRLRPNSPAFALGFQRIPLERIGPAGYRP